MTWKAHVGERLDPDSHLGFWSTRPDLTQRTIRESGRQSAAFLTKLKCVEPAYPIKSDRIATPVEKQSGVNDHN